MRPATPLICAFGDKHKHTYGVTPICRALAVHGVQIASRTYFADRAAAPSKRALWDTTITEILAGYYEPDAEGKRPPECLYGSLKMWAHLQRQGFRWPSATVKTIMRANGWRGVPLAAHITHHRTRPGRGPGPRPGGSAMAGFSNEPAGSGRLHLRADDVEFRLHRVRGRRLRRVIAGWECSLTKDAAFVERALRHGLPDSPRSPVWRSYSSSRRRKSVYCNIFRQDTDASRAAAVDRHCWRRPRQRLM